MNVRIINSDAFVGLQVTPMIRTTWGGTMPIVERQVHGLPFHGREIVWELDPTK